MVFVGWMVNKRPQWVAYHTLTSYHVVGLNKHPVVWPVGVGKTW